MESGMTDMVTRVAEAKWIANMHKTVHKELAPLREAIERPTGKWKIRDAALKENEEKA